MDVQGKTVALSGQDSGFRRAGGKARIKEVLMDLGAKVTASVSGKTSLLIYGIVGADANRRKAQELGIAEMNEAKFYSTFSVGKAKPKAKAKAAAKKSTVPHWQKRRWDMSDGATQGVHKPSSFTELPGVTVTLTGAFQTMKRPQLEDLCKEAGAKVMKSVGAKTQLVVAGQSSGSKFANAISSGCPTIDEVELHELLGRPWPVPTGLEGPLADWLPRFLDRVKSLRAHPDVVILNTFVGPPASEAKIKAAGERLGGLPPGLANLYRQCDGLTFSWIHKDHPSCADTDVKIFKTFGRLNTTGLDPATGGYGIPNLKSLVDTYAEDMSLTRNEEWTIEWAGETINHHDLAQRTHTFDHAGGYRPFFLSMLTPDAPYVFFGDDHGGDWEGSRLSSVEVYLEATLAHFASYAARATLYAEYPSRGLKRFELGRAHWADNPPTLKEVVG